ncbi:hypothetical protein GH714_035779 [Hevea brasiliensis]|uniref:Pentatricopeptide repeat-containing protein n=1 Tax=Hevea brasiliensis TaxID=3981 RepID=A0A6A6KS42_HEVBR|nr:hypothetical protein GH714_035779 [Hevea brasiliensis]
MGKEGLIVAKELKRLQSDPLRLDRFMKSHVSRLLKSDLVAVLAEFQRQDQVDEVKLVWQDLKREGVLFDQHTFGDIIRAFLDSGLPSEAMDIYEEMRQSPDLPLSLPFRVILKGLLPYPDLREKVKDDFLELFPNMIVYDPAEDLFEDQDRGSEDD